MSGAYARAVVHDGGERALPRERHAVQRLAHRRRRQTQAAERYRTRDLRQLRLEPLQPAHHSTAQHTIQFHCILILKLIASFTILILECSRIEYGDGDVPVDLVDDGPLARVRVHEVGEVRVQVVEPEEVVLLEVPEVPLDRRHVVCNAMQYNTIQFNSVQFHCSLS